MSGIQYKSNAGFVYTTRFERDDENELAEQTWQDVFTSWDVTLGGAFAGRVAAAAVDGAVKAYAAEIAHCPVCGHNGRHNTLC